MNEVLDKVDNDLMLRVAQFKDLDDIYNLYVERVDWFRHKDIGQWKYYLDFHPKEEFYDIIKNKRLYVVIKDYEIVGAVEIKYINKEFWNDEKNNTVYIKKLVTKIGVKDIGSFVINYIKDLAVFQKLNSIRLECEASNDKLNDIYYKYGFKFVDYVYRNNIRYNLRECVII